MQRWPRQLLDDRLEKDVERAVDRTLRELGCIVCSTSQRRPSGQAIGLPDRIVLAPHWGFHCCFELKRARGGRVSKAQEAWHQLAERTGLRCFVVASVADALAALQAMGAPIEVQGRGQPR